MSSFLAELRRRNVVRVAMACAIVGWLLIEVAATLLPIFGAPDWLLRAFTFFVLLGFPVALVLSWIYDLTPEGLERTGAEAESGGARPASGSKLNVAVVGLLVVAVGYMFVDNYVLDAPRPPFAGAEVDPDSLGAPSVEPPAAAAVQPPPPIAGEQPAAPLSAIAVLPFDNLSPDPDNSYFASGMHEEILNSLAKLSALDVKSRTSVLRYAENKPPIEEIAAELEVGSVLEGSVRFADNRVRVTTQLIEASSGNHLWSETYEHEFEDIFAIESDVAMNIANALEAEFSEEEQQRIYTPRTDSPAALALLWQAAELANSGNWPDAFPLLDRAIELDPDFAGAYATRAWGNAVMLRPVAIQAADDPDAFVAEREAVIAADAERALALDPEMGAAYSAIATVHELHRRGAEAREAHQRAYELLPGVTGVLWVYSQFSYHTGEHAEAIRLAEEAARLDPTQSLSLLFLGNAHLFAGDLDAAEAAYRSLLAADPAGVASVALGQIEALRSNDAEALAHLQIEEQLRPRVPPPRAAQMALWYSVAGQPDEARRLFTRIEQIQSAGGTINSMAMAAAHLAVGNSDEALQSLRAVVADENRLLGRGELEFVLKFNLANLPVLEEPEFIEVRQQLGFTDL